MFTVNLHARESDTFFIVNFFFSELQERICLEEEKGQDGKCFGQTDKKFFFKVL